MLLTILVPEYLIGKAFGERLAAKFGLEIMKSEVTVGDIAVERLDEVVDTVKSLRWEEIHAYMANIGYFVVDFSDVLDDHRGMDREPRSAFNQ